MRVQISFKVINSNYDQEYADEYNFGKEGESNMKYDWETTYEIKEANSVELIENGTYLLKGTLNNGRAFESQIPNVTIFRIHLKDGSMIEFAVSKSILNKTHQTHNEKYKIIRCYFYINSEPKSIELTDKLVIDVNEIPDELKIK
jgi:hypothetical protein